MKAPKKVSRNATRKRLYADLADGASRNQNTLPRKNCPSCLGRTGIACIVCSGTGSVATREKDLP